jgi:hypothetical protein
MVSREILERATVNVCHETKAPINQIQGETVTKLNQIVAIDKQVKADANAKINAVYHLFQKAEPFAGLVRTNAPLADDGFALPAESKKVTARVPELVDRLQEAWTRLADVTLTKDTTNCEAKADIKVGDLILVEQVPVSTLLWLEKQLVDLRTMLSKVPVLDVAEDWTWDEGNKVYRSATVETVRTKKVTEFVTAAPATEKHPAQVVQVNKDLPDSVWSTTKLSGAVSTSLRDKVLGRVAELQEAVKKARETANLTEVTDKKMADALLGFVFGS